MLAVKNLEVTYEDVVLVLRGVSLEVPEGKIVALLGANGAGKTTLLRAMCGLLDIHQGDVEKGTITLEGNEIQALPAQKVVASGIAQVMEGRRVFGEFTVEENLRVGAHTNRAKHEENRDRVFELFPRLHERRAQRGGTLSGGEQQMLAIGRALMGRPKLLLLDEPSLGLAPLVVKQIFGAIRQIATEQNMTIFLVEQNAFHALRLADRGYVMVNGSITMSGTGQELLSRPEVRAAYLEGGHG